MALVCGSPRQCARENKHRYPVNSTTHLSPRYRGALCIRIEAAARAADDMPILPTQSMISRSTRWMSAFGVTFRTVNLRYEISRSKHLFRLKLFGAVAFEYASSIVHCSDPIDYDSWDLTNISCKFAVLLSVRFWQHVEPNESRSRTALQPLERYVQ